MIIDATDKILGRMATFVAKKALQGEKVEVINSEKAVVTGDKSQVLAKFKQRKDRGIPLKGPYYPKKSEAIVRRAIRGMLPFKRSKGREAFKNVVCYASVPDHLKDKKPEEIKNANIDKVPNLRYITIERISQYLGGK